MHGHGGTYVGFRRALEACALLQRRNERANDGGGGGKRLTMVCCWWDFQATLGKTILLSDIAGTALSTTRLVDWLLLMLLNPLVDFHRDRTICFRALDRRASFGLASRKGEVKRVVSQRRINPSDNSAAIYCGNGADSIELTTCADACASAFI